MTDKAMKKKKKYKKTIKAIFKILEREKEVEKFLSPVEFEIFELVKKNLED